MFAMNPRGQIVLVLLCLGAGAAAGYWLARRPDAAPAMAMTATVPVPPAVTNVMVEVVPVPAPAAPGAALDWRSVESPDYREYIQNLRRIGCPEETIRDIIIADVSKLYASRRAALDGPPKTYRYWESSDRQFDRENLRRQQAIRALQRERAALVRDLLGVDYEREVERLFGEGDNFDRTLAFLPPERADGVRAMLDRFRDAERAIYEAADGELTPDQRAAVDNLRKQRDAELAAMLTPAELQEYELTNSRLAREIRGNLYGFEATEAEFRAIYDLRKAFEDQFGNGRDRGREDEAAREARRQAQAQLEEKLRLALGPERYAEYKRSLDDDYQQLFRVAKRYDLPKQSAVAVYDVRKTVEAQKREIERNTTFTPDQRAAVLNELAKATRETVQGVLGESAFKYYLRRDGGWLDRLNRVTPQRTDGRSALPAPRG
jgi:hypothetical protein